MKIYCAKCTGKEDNAWYPDLVDVYDAETLARAAGRDYVCAEYLGSHRANANFVSSDCIALDFDNDHSEDPAQWIRPRDVMAAFAGVTVGIHYSRNHMKEKNGKPPRPKFHVLLAIRPVTDQGEYRKLKGRAAAVFPQCDPNALDSAHFFYGTPDPKVEFYPGDRMLEDVLEDLFSDDPDEPAFDAGRPRGTYGDRVIPEGSRNATMSHFGGKLAIRYGWNETTREIFFREADKCDPPLPDEELEKIWQSCKRFAKVVSQSPGYIPPEQFNASLPDGPVGSLKPADYSDIGEAKMVYKEYGDVLAFHPGTDYLQYDGIVWNENKDLALGSVEEFLDLQLADAQLLAMTTKEAFLNAGGSREALAGTKKDLASVSGDLLRLLLEYLTAKDYEKFVLQWRNMKHTVPTMNALKPMVSIDIDELNQDPLLLNTPSASYDLRHGLAGRREHNAGDFCTKVTAVDPGDEGRELWEKALNDTFRGDQELIAYVQEVLGLAAIGRVYMEVMIIAYGGGRNGKSTFWNTVSRVLGTYGGDVSADTLTIGCKRNVKPEMAELKGVRLALAKELEENTRLNTSVVKQLTSTDAILGEKKYCKPAAFLPSHTLVLYTNHLPRVGASDEGTWRRLIVVPFTAVFKGKGDIKNYSDYLFTHAGPYILKWIIEGAERIIRKEFHLTNPPVVQAAIDEYRNQNDWMTEFLQECCELTPSGTIMSGELYQEYRAYCERMGEFTRSTTDFYAELDKRDVLRKRTKKGVIVHGIRLRSVFEE